MIPRSVFTLALFVAVQPLAAAPLRAQTVIDPKPVRTTDVITKPLSDMNIKKDEIPPILVAARERPYDVAGLRGCAAIQGEVRALDAALGEDFDVAAAEGEVGKRRGSVGNVAKSIVGSLIPFGGIIREVSGANANEHNWQVALFAGASRRAFLKGYGQQKGCRYPARPATAKDVALILQMRDKQAREAEARKR